MSAWSVAYYVYCLSALAFLSVLILSVHRLMWLAYVGQTLIGLLYVAALDGDLQILLGLGDVASDTLIVLTGAALAVYSLTLVERVAQPHPLVDRLRTPLLLTAAGAALLPLGLLVAPFGTLHTALLCLLAVAFVAQALPPLTWGFLPRPLRPRAMPVIQVLVLAIAIGTALLSTQLTVAAQDWLIARRVILVGCATAGIITMVYMTYIIERTRAASARRAIRAAEREASTSKALLAAEREYNRIQQLAAERTEQLSTVSHDLRQPLGSLRATLDGLLNEQSGDVIRQASQALDYLDELAGSFVDHSPAQPQRAASTAEDIPVAVLLASLQQMFRGEAEARGVTIRVAPSSLCIRAVPVPLMRVLANLLANALKHSHCDQILLGARRGQTVSIQVIDNGRGLHSEPCSEPTSGSGLGLNIVRELCGKHGFHLETQTKTGAGSQFSLHVARA